MAVGLAPNLKKDSEILLDGFIRRYVKNGSTHYIVLDLILDDWLNLVSQSILLTMIVSSIHIVRKSDKLFISLHYYNIYFYSLQDNALEVSIFKDKYAIKTILWLLTLFQSKQI